MKTTNLITDFLIIGLLGFITLVFPFLLIDHSGIETITNKDVKNSWLLIVIMTLLLYSFGIIYYQLADSSLGGFMRIFRLNFTEDEKANVESNLGYDYHYALQKIILHSKNSFDYLSYRRTMLRIFRAFIFSSILFIMLHLVYSALILILTEQNLYFSWQNTLVLTFIMIACIFFWRVYLKLQKGYMDSIINFARLIDESKISNVQS